MSDTPETDALITTDAYQGIDGYMTESAYDRMTEHALILERERDAATELLAAANDSIKDMRDRVELHRKAANDLGKERDEAREALHYANGTADLAMRHRDAAERALSEFRDQVAEITAVAMERESATERERDDLRAENQRLTKILADLAAIREMDC